MIARHDPALVGNQPRAEPDIGRALDAQRVLGAVAFGRIFRAVEQRIDGLLALDVDDAQRLAALQQARPGPFGRDVVRVHRIGGIGIAMDIVFSSGMEPIRELEGADDFRRRRPAGIVGRGGRRAMPDERDRAAGGRARRIERMRRSSTAPARDLSRRAGRRNRRAVLRAPFQTKRPSASSETGAKKVTQGGMSRRPSPSLDAAARKFSWRVARRLAVGGKRRGRRRAAHQQIVRAAGILDQRQEDPAHVGQDDAALGQGGAPLDLGRVGAVEPLRHDRSRTSRSPTRSTRPEASTILSASPRRSRTVSYQPGGTLRG